ncbi:MAG: NAD(P)H-dependent oxidoreductase [Pseudomonadota bacterium]
MPGRITIIQGHPDDRPAHLCHALADAYRAGAESAGYEVRYVPVAALAFPVLRSREAYEHQPPPGDIREAQSTIRTSDHLVIVYPLWLGTMPALLKAFLEQVFRYDFAFEPGAAGLARKLLKGRSARIVITMGMPAAAYRLYFGAHSLKSLERNVLKFAGISPIRESLFGGVESAGDGVRRKWLQRMRRLGTAGR